MKHTDFLEMANNSSEGRRGTPGSGVTFVPPQGGTPQRIMLRINGGGPLPVVSVGIVPVSQKYLSSVLRGIACIG